MLQALTYDPDNPDLLYASLQLAAATGRHEEAVQLAGRVLKINPQHSLAVLVMAVEAARQGDLKGAEAQLAVQIGRASCRERVCQYVSISVVAVSLTKKRAQPVLTE